MLWFAFILLLTILALLQAAPSKSFNAPTDSEIDADSPLTETLVEKIRDALVHLEEWLGKNYTAAVDHDHDGVNSKTARSNPAIGFDRTEEEFTEASTTSTSFQTVNTHRLQIPVAGTFTVYGSYNLKTALASQNGVIAQVLIDGTTAVAVSAERTNGTYAYVDASSTGVALTAGWHTFAVQYKKVNNGGADDAYIDGYAVAVR